MRVYFSMTAKTATMARPRQAERSRRIASSPGFAYSPALQGKGGVWTEENLDEFLRDPEAFAPGTTMRLSGLDDRSRAEVTAELASHARSSE